MTPSRPKSRDRTKSRTRSSSNKLELAPADELKREIQAVLTDDLRSGEHTLGHGRFDGFAYPAAEAYFNLAGGHGAGLHPMHLKYRHEPLVAARLTGSHHRPHACPAGEVRLPV